VDEGFALRNEGEAIAEMIAQARKSRQIQRVELKQRETKQVEVREKREKREEKRQVLREASAKPAGRNRAQKRLRARNNDLIALLDE
jgi:hypothetical protein